MIQNEIRISPARKTALQEHSFETGEGGTFWHLAVSNDAEFFWDWLIKTFRSTQKHLYTQNKHNRTPMDLAA